VILSFFLGFYSAVAIISAAVFYMVDGAWGKSKSRLELIINTILFAVFWPVTIWALKK